MTNKMEGSEERNLEWEAYTVCTSHRSLLLNLPGVCAKKAKEVGTNRRLVGDTKEAKEVETNE